MSSSHLNLDPLNNSLFSGFATELYEFLGSPCLGPVQVTLDWQSVSPPWPQASCGTDDII